MQETLRIQRERWQIKFPKRRRNRIPRKRIRTFIGPHIDHLFDTHPFLTITILFLVMTAIVVMLYLLQAKYLGII